MTQIASIFFEGTAYFSLYKPMPFEPHSAATQLIQGLYEEYPETAIRILRNKIYLNYTPTVMCRGMIWLGAKRFEVDMNLNEDQINRLSIKRKITFEPKQNLTSFSTVPLPEILLWLKNPAEKKQDSASTSPLFTQHRAVRSVILDAQDQVILAAENQNSSNKTLHAEVILLQDYFRKNRTGFNRSITLFSSLQCCKMCAAMIWWMHSDPWNQLQVIYLEPEKGSSARDTILTKNGNLRREYASNSLEILKQIEFSLEDSSILKKGCTHF